jgi:hypothetical protein
MNDEINLPENEMISAQAMKYLLDRENARHERIVKRLIISYTIILLLIIGSIIYFVVTSDIESTTIDQDGEGVNIVGDSNGVDYNGADSTDSQEQAEEPQAS